MDAVPLRQGLPGGGWACLRSMVGEDEALVEGDGILDAVGLLDRLLVATPGTTVGPGSGARLALTDRDRLLAYTYRERFGDRVQGTLECASCGGAFELSLSIGTLLEHLDDGGPSGLAGPDDDGVYTLPDGRRFRLPTTEDQKAVLTLPADEAAAEILRRCVIEGDPDADTKVLQEAIEAVGPVLDLDLVVSCPECGGRNRVRFDMPSYLLGSLIRESRFLDREVHCLARAYGWGLCEILALPADRRRAQVRLVQAEWSAGRRGAA